MVDEEGMKKRIKEIEDVLNDNIECQNYSINELNELEKEIEILKRYI